MIGDIVRVVDTDGNVLENYILKSGEELAVVNKRKELSDRQVEFLRQNEDLKKLNSELGGFVTMCYVKNELLFNELNLVQANISRLIYLSTYLEYNDKEDGLLVYVSRNNKKLPMNRKSMRSKLRLSENAFKRFLYDVKEYNLIFEVDNKLYLNPEYFTRGTCNYNSKEYTRLYIEPIRSLFENSTVTSHKQLANIFRLIPMMHYDLNVICYNPNETNTKKIKDISLIDICRMLGIDETNRSKFKREMLKFYVTLEGEKFYLFKHVVVEGLEDKKDYFVINPYVIYKGNNPKMIIDIGKLFYFG